MSELVDRLFDAAVDLVADDGGPYVSLPAAARDIGVPERTVRRWCADGTLRGAHQAKKRGSWRIPLRQVQLARLARAEPCPHCGRCG